MKTHHHNTTAGQLAFNAALDTYQGAWGEDQLTHLIRRTTFGLDLGQIKSLLGQGMETTVQQLLADTPLPEPPVSFDGNDEIVSIGQDWTQALYPRTNKSQTRTSRYRSLYAWTMGLLGKKEISIREKLTLFWHNHFAVERIKVNDPKYLYQYQQLLRQHALGNFKTLVQAITINPAMLRYLDGRDNTKTKPNENYARELLELFTIGKGAAVGEGDYTYYTEDDVVALSRILTGWKDAGYYSPSIEVPDVEFLPGQHDEGDKQLSHRFDNMVITGQGAEEYRALIDVIFQKEEPARFIVRKLYRWLVNFDLTPEVETQVITPLADLLITSNWQIRPVLFTLLTSQHFYEEANRGAIIKNPLEFIFSVINTMEVQLPENSEKWYQVLLALHNFMARLDMQYFYPPNVAGWSAYYQAPAFYQNWISSVTLPERMQFTDKISGTGRYFQQFKLIIDSLSVIDKLEEPADPNEMIRELTRLLLPKPITERQFTILKDILLPGLPDYEWTLEYVDYRDNPQDENLKKSVEKQLNALFQAILSMPEFYLA